MDAPDPSPLDLYSHTAPDGRVFCRGTAVCLSGQGVLALGPSGSGKSRLALELLTFGAQLVADDGLWLTTDNLMHRPERAPRLIEARGIGLLNAEVMVTAPLTLIIDLSSAEPDRLPPRRLIDAPGGPVPLILGKDHPFLAVAICQYLKQGRAE